MCRLLQLAQASIVPSNQIQEKIHINKYPKQKFAMIVEKRFMFVSLV